MGAVAAATKPRRSRDLPPFTPVSPVRCRGDAVLITIVALIVLPILFAKVFFYYALLTLGEGHLLWSLLGFLYTLVFSVGACFGGMQLAAEVREELGLD